MRLGGGGGEVPRSLSAEQDLAPGVLSSSLAQGQVLEGLGAGGGEEPTGPPTDDTFLQETQELLLKIFRYVLPHSFHPGLFGEDECWHHVKDDFNLIMNIHLFMFRDSFPWSLSAAVATAGRSWAVSLRYFWLQMHGNNSGGNSTIQQVYGQCNLFYDQITPG